MWLTAGFATLGLLLGNLVGMTSESVVGQLVGLLFVFVGGSIFAFLNKLAEADRAVAGKLLMAVSLATLVGVSCGITVNEFRLLSPRTRLAGTAGGEEKYVRSGPVSKASAIDIKRATGVLTSDDAYQRMYELATAYEDASRSSR